MNDKKPLMDYRGFKNSNTAVAFRRTAQRRWHNVSIPLVILGIAIMLFCHRDRCTLLPLPALRQAARTHRR